MNWILIIIAYWIVCVIGTYIVRNKARRKRPFSSRTPIWIHIAIFLLIPICMPFVLAYCLFSMCKKAYFKNRPRAVATKLSKSIKEDSVVDENGKTKSTSESNRQQGTSTTFQDICEETNERVPEEEEKKQPTLKLQDGLPETPHYIAAKRLGEGLSINDLSSFGAILSEDAILVIYGGETIRGKSKIISYWEWYIQQFIESGKIHNFVVKQCNYYINACLAMDHMYVLFHFKEQLVSTILFTPYSIDEYISCKDAMFDTLPYTLEKAEEFFHELEDRIKNIPDYFNNRTPCLHCGCESSELEWHECQVIENKYGYKGEMSVCPHCRKIVEYHRNIKLKYNNANQLVVDNDDLPF